ncbi:winged helix-turn-helix domain-containing protein [Kitasatospora sp. NPDC049258]|uniref:winged helix-turn-helix domain-containing protein n=1 Tax=Kitasatospora sp. NPDC049258 TaxID=3155394 RepID=UPI00344A0318
MSLYYPRVSRIHSTWPPADDGPGPVRPTAAVSGIVVDPVRRTAAAGGRLLKLTFMEFELLAHLVAHPLRVHSRRQLLASVWDQEPFGDTRTIDVHVARLRRKLGPELRDTIATVRQVGYCYDPGARPRP